MKKKKKKKQSRRRGTSVDYSLLTKKKPEKKLLRPLLRKAGRGYGGRVTVRHRGGGHKRKYRIIDFKQRDKIGIPAKVLALEYDPNRTCFIALLEYSDGEKRYILAPEGLRVGDQIIAQPEAPLKTGNRMQLKNIPVGTSIYNLELSPGQGGQIIRSAGSSAQVLANEGGYVQVKLPSGEVRLFREECFASIGQLSNPEHNTVIIGKAGRSRWLGQRPRVRGSAMNPRDHPHGGGENRQSIGLRKGPKTPWGKLAYGLKTRKKNKASDRLIVKRRKRGK